MRLDKDHPQTTVMSKRPRCSRCKGYVELRYESTRFDGTVPHVLCLNCGARYYRTLGGECQLVTKDAVPAIRGY